MNDETYGAPKDQCRLVAGSMHPRELRVRSSARVIRVEPLRERRATPTGRWVDGDLLEP